MTLKERVKFLEERLQDRRNVFAQVQRECFQLEGAIFAIRELMNERQPDNSGNGLEAGQQVGHPAEDVNVAE